MQRTEDRSKHRVRTGSMNEVMTHQQHSPAEHQPVSKQMTAQPTAQKSASSDSPDSLTHTAPRTAGIVNKALTSKLSADAASFIPGQRSPAYTVIQPLSRSTKEQSYTAPTSQLTTTMPPPTRTDDSATTTQTHPDTDEADQQQPQIPITSFPSLSGHQGTEATNNNLQPMTDQQENTRGASSTATDKQCKHVHFNLQENQILGE